MDEKKRRFVRVYLKDLDPADAARQAGLAHHVRSGTAARLLRRPDTGAAIKRGLAGRRRRKLLSADRVLEELARIAFADIRDVARWDADGVTIHAPEDISDDAAAAVAEISARGGAPRIRLHDKKAALLALARHLGLFEPRGEAADPKAEREAADALREMLLARVAALATPADKPANGEDA